MSDTFRYNKNKNSCWCGNKTCHKFYLDCTPKKSWYRYLNKFHNDKIGRILVAELG